MTDVRTSVTHPLAPGYLRLPDAIPGRIGFCMAPGRTKGKGAYAWARDLSADIHALKEAGCEVLVTLMQPAEIRRDISGNLFDALQSQGIQSIHFPIRDKALPSSRVGYRNLIGQISSLVQSGRHVVIHCNGGKGRSATVTASVFRRLANASYSEAKREVRRAVPGCFVNPLQHAWVLAVR
eukprot:m.189519 g.189519  ORF g.189519 m.189519 type:complete len:181 (+) comp53609_c0_seq2:163-705(+)